jgi:cytoskeleton protein RodZ
MRRLSVIEIEALSGVSEWGGRGIPFALSLDAMPDDQSKDIGAELAQARERRGFSLTELSQRTKITVEALKAIERGDMAALPGGLYTRGFLRSFAREVGCNPDEIVRRYRENFKETDLAASAMAQLDSGVSVTCPPGQVHVKDIDAMTRRRSRTAWISGTALVLLGAALHFAWVPSASWIGHHAATQSTASKADTTAPAAASKPDTAASAPTSSTSDTKSLAPPAATPIGTAGPKNDQKPTDAAAGHALHLNIKPSGDCWLSATADGQRVVYRLMTAGESTQIDAQNDIVLVVGDPATCAIDINGTSIRRLGAAGQPVTVHLTRDNFQTYLQGSTADRPQ